MPSKRRKENVNDVDAKHEAAIARLEEGLDGLKANVGNLWEELRYLRRGIVNRLIWAILVLALSLGGKDVLQTLVP